MSLFDDAKLIITPNGYKAGKLYSLKPFDGSGDCTVVRNTTATRVNSAGLIESVAVNIPRLDYSGGVTCPAVLVEPQRTNLVLRSQEFDNASWGKVRLNNFGSGSVANSPDTLSPIGLFDSEFIQQQTGNTSTGGVLQACLTNTITYTISVFAKQGSQRFLRLGGAFNASGAAIFGGFDLELGIVGTMPTGVVGRIENYGNGWFRCSFTATKVDLIGNAIFIYQANSLNGATATFNSGLYIWGAQVEEGAKATSYIPTVAATVTRNADVITATPPVGTTEITEYLKDITYYIGGNNLFLYSEEFDNAIWSKARSSVVANDTISPDGNLTAEKMFDSVDNNTHLVFQTVQDLNIGEFYSLSMFIKKGSLTKAFLAFDSGLNESVVFDLDIGTIYFEGSSVEGSSIVNYGNGWYKCSITHIASTINRLYRVGIFNGSLIYEGTGTDFIYIWGAQVEQGAEPTAYQATRGIIDIPVTYQIPNGQISKVIMI